MNHHRRRRHHHHHLLRRLIQKKTRERKSKKKHKKKHKKRHRHYEDNNSSETDNGEDGSRRKHNKKIKKRKKHGDKHSERSNGGKSRKKRGDNSLSDDFMSDEEESNQSRHVPKRKRDKKRRKRARSREKNEYKSINKVQEDDPFELKYGCFLTKLHELLSDHGDLATELPYLLIKLCSGSSINLSQIPDLSVSSKLKELFKLLGCTALSQDEFIFDDNGNWEPSSRGVDDARALVLVKLVRFLMNRNDLTMENVIKYEEEEKQETEARRKKEIKGLEMAKEQEETDESEMSSIISILLDTFQSKQSKQSSSLGQELCSIMEMIHDGEIICLDGLEDDFLKEALEQFFAIIGLVKEEMDESDEEDTEKQEERTSYGYTLPNVESDIAAPVKQKLLAAIHASKIYHDKKTKHRIGPILPKDASSYKVEIPPTSGESEDEGPAPFGSHKSIAISTKQQINPKQNKPSLEKQEGKREEWMMAPGEHDFLKGVLSKGVIKSRKFKNEKNSNPPPAPKPLNPEIKKQVDSIMDAHRAARGPSLIEQHRLQKAEEEAAKKAAGPKDKNGKSWNWSRSKDLDAGRRVDKNYLNMVMGGAQSDLKSKFQGSYSAGFT